MAECSGNWFKPLDKPIRRRIYFRPGKQKRNGVFVFKFQPVFKRTQALSEYNNIEDIAFDQARKCLYEKNLLGISNAEALLNAVWLFNSVNFSLRGCEEHRQMTWGDVQLHMEADGTEYLECFERQTKTSTGAELRNVRSC